jgi:hypothetical protein
MEKGGLVIWICGIIINSVNFEIVTLVLQDSFFTYFNKIQTSANMSQFVRTMPIGITIDKQKDT